MFDDLILKKDKYQIIINKYTTINNIYRFLETKTEYIETIPNNNHKTNTK